MEALGGLLEGKTDPQSQVDELKSRLKQLKDNTVALSGESWVFDELISLEKELASRRTPK